MCRRVDVCPPLADMREGLSEEPITVCSAPLVVPMESFPFLVRESWPVRNAWLESIREIDESFRDQNFVNVEQRRFVPSRAEGSGSAEQSRLSYGLGG